LLKYVILESNQKYANDLLSHWVLMKVCSACPWMADRDNPLDGGRASLNYNG